MGKLASHNTFKNIEELCDMSKPQVAFGVPR
jgi:hypothetical protein